MLTRVPYSRLRHRLHLVLVAALMLLTVLDAAPILAQDSGEDIPVQPLVPSGSSRVFMPVLRGSEARQTGAIVPDEYIVVLKDAADSQIESSAVVAERMAATYGGKVLFTYDTALNGFAIALPPDAAVAVAADPSVDYVEPNRVVNADTSQTGATWGLDRIDQRNLPLNSVYNYTPNGSGVHAYIIDTGIRGTHSQFTGRMGAGYTAITDGRGTNDCHGHGTHVAGTVGGTRYGVAKRVTLHPVRVLDCTGSGSTAGVIAGINWVSNNKVKPAVANMSLGGSGSASLDAAVNNSIAKGIVYVVAGGNSNDNACYYSPARVPNAITVGATTSTDARAYYSNYGSCLDIFAPGSSITSAWNSSDSAINTISGTSMASPHVAGAAALYLQRNPAATPTAVRNALFNNASIGKVSDPRTGSPNRLLYTGFLGSAPGACTELLQNRTFDSGPGTWAQGSTNGFQLICTSSSCGSTISPRSPYYMGWLGGANSETSILQQTVSLPAGKPARLRFYYQIGSSDYCGYDYGYAHIIVSSGAYRLQTFSLCASNNSSGWNSVQYDLSAYAGQTVTVDLRSVNDSSLNSNFFIDDTSLGTGACAELDALDSPLLLPEEQPLPSIDAGVPTNSAPKPATPLGPVDTKQK